MQGCICHFVKWQIHPFIFKGTSMWPCPYLGLRTSSTDQPYLDFPPIGPHHRESLEDLGDEGIHEPGSRGICYRGISWPLRPALYCVLHLAHDVVATLNQRQGRGFNVATTSCDQWGSLSPSLYLSLSYATGCTLHVYEHLLLLYYINHLATGHDYNIIAFWIFFFINTLNTNFLNVASISHI